MKKSNYLIFAVLAVITAFLLYLWYYLGFSKVDNPVDLTLTIIWWLGIAVLIALVVRQEKKRQRQVRTVHVAPGKLFNSEVGVVEVAEGQDAVAAMEQLLQGLKYGFKAQEQPKAEDFDYRFVVQSETFKAGSKEAGEGTQDAEHTAGKQPEWKGMVTKIDRENGNVETPFESVDELKQALAQ